MAKKTFKLDPAERQVLWKGILDGMDSPAFSGGQRSLRDACLELLEARDSRGIVAHHSARRLKFRYTDEERRGIVQALKIAQTRDDGRLDASDKALLPHLLSSFES